MVVAANDVGDAHRDVVDDDTEIVRGRSVRADEDPVVELAVLERDRPVDEIVHHRRALGRNPEPQRAGGEASLAAAAGIAERLAPLLGRLPLAVEKRGRTVAVVGAPGGEEPPGVLAIAREPLGLTVARRRRPFVPVEPEPPEGVDDGDDVLVGRPRAVRVLDAQDEGAVVVAREEPVEERGARAADVEMARRARREPYADRRGHVSRSRTAGPTGCPRRPGCARDRWSDTREGR